jgi:hypothetical protein
MINLARLTSNWGLGSLPRPSVWAHAYVQVFGFMALFVMGVAYHVLPRFVGGTLQNARLAQWSFRLQLAGVILIACGFFHDAVLTRPLWLTGTTALLVASTLFRTVVMRTLASGTPGREPFRQWVAAGAGWLAPTTWRGIACFGRRPSSALRAPGSSASAVGSFQSSWDVYRGGRSFSARSS